MSNYIKATDFASKDTLPTGSPSKVIKGTEINSELNLIQSAISTKADTNSPVFTGVPETPTAALSTENTQIASTAFVKQAIRAMYPVGSLYINTANATNPNILFGFGTWVLFAAGRTLVCIDTSNPIMDSPEEAFGRSDAINVSHTHGVNDPTHTHTINDAALFSTDDTPTNTTVLRLQGSNQTTGNWNGSGLGTLNYITNSTTGISIQASGSDGANQNYQPSIAVYMWKRTA